PEHVIEELDEGVFVHSDPLLQRNLNGSGLLAMIACLHKLADAAAHDHAFDHPNADQHRQQRRAAGTHEWQRQAGDGQDAQIHPDRHDRMEEYHAAHAIADQAPDRVGGARRAQQAAPDYNAYQDDDGCRADKPQFFGDHAEDEVCVPHAQKASLRLRAVGVALAHEAARADADQRLVDVVAAVFVVGDTVTVLVNEHTLAAAHQLRIVITAFACVNEGDDALALVIFHRRPHHRH